MSKTQKIKIIFDKNFSSANNVNLTSERGLGLKIVKEKIEALGGSIDVNTEIGLGTTFSIQLPISRSLFRALLIKSGNQVFSIPLDDIQNLFEVAPEDIKEINHEEYVKSNETGELLRLYHLKKLFKSDKTLDESTNTHLKIVHIQKGDTNYALFGG